MSEVSSQLCFTGQCNRLRQPARHLKFAQIVLHYDILLALLMRSVNRINSHWSICSIVSAVGHGVIGVNINLFFDRAPHHTITRSCQT